MTAALVPLDTGDNRLIDLWVFGKAEQTADAYRRDARQFLAFVGKPLSAVTLSDLQGYALSLEPDKALPEGEKRRKAASQRRKLASIKSLLSYGQRVGLLPVNVGAAVRLQRQPVDLAERILSESDIHRMIALEPDRRNVAILRLLYATAARASEVAGLTWSNVTERADGSFQVTLHGKGNKTRVVWLPSSLRADIETLRAQHAPTVAGVGRVQLWRIVTTAARRAGLDIDAGGKPRSVSTHWMRHAHISHSLDRGAPVHLVRETAGHASLETTTAYAHARPDTSSAKYLAL